MNRNRQGFTLVELAIVLVIIGLLVGGILVGQDLIKAATVRTTVSDIEKINSAANTFRTKYGGLPGDLMASRANEFGLNTANANTTGRNGDPGKGDGNSIMEGCAVNATALGCETAYFWVDLAAASLIPQRLNTYTGSVTTVNSAAAAAIPNYIPRTRLRDSTYLHVFPHNSRNYFYVGGITDTSAAGAPTLDKGLSNGEARSLDEKFDDGLPLVGIVTAITALSGTLETAATAADGVCVTTTPANTYNLNDDYINSVSCRLMMRTSF